MCSIVLVTNSTASRPRHLSAGTVEIYSSGGINSQKSSVVEDGRAEDKEKEPVQNADWDVVDSADVRG